MVCACSCSLILGSVSYPANAVGDVEMPFPANKVSQEASVSGEGLSTVDSIDSWFSLIPVSCMLAQRRVAKAAKPPGLGSGSAHAEDATEQIEEDREERDDTSEIIDSGEDNDELVWARDDRRADVENGWGRTGLQEGVGLSRFMRALHAS